jgi:predicted TIM-barrel fold metal-dependent hydrolase
MSDMRMTNPSKLAEEFMETGRLSSLSIIDVHTHMGPFYGTFLPEARLESMIRTMERENIEWIISAPHSALFDPIAGNTEIVQVMAQYPKQIYGYYTVNPNYGDSLDQDLAEFDEHEGYVGFKLLPDYHKYPLNGDKFKKIYEFANERGLLLLSHTWGYSQYNPPQMIAELAKQYSNITFLMGHSAPGECDVAIEVASTMPNVYLDLCDTHRLSGMVRKMVEAASSEKVLFGTDLPWYDPHYCLGSVLFSGISDPDMQNIIHHNAVRLLNGIIKP